ncbi:HNH endonuclease [Bradyrhizobium erythrophlei]|uniref:HNH endonuclease n=2 Tax=Bradyrhizobium erythrophlei TaxID=1437360 RepID=A0A1M5MQE2_9BRAD|nr:HNH endonuclease [Bradyrhizobium erythrophlei]
MSSRPKITGRVTSLAAAFVHAIIPRRVNIDVQAKLYERFRIEPKECVYCGREATDQDHFRAIVKGGKPSGYFHTADNVVPSCGKCNQSKGGAGWKAWMNSTAKGSPRTRGVIDLSERVDRLSKFEEATNTVQFTEDEMRAAVGADLWDSYWRRLDDLAAQMRSAQAEAEKICSVLQQEFDARSG